MTKTYRNANGFAIIIGSFTILPGETIDLVDYNGSMLKPVDEPAAEATVADEKPKRARKATAWPVADTGGEQ